MACKAFYNLTGINPTFGGSHVNRGTKNYLVNIGGNKYLELIGLDDMQNVEEIVKKHLFPHLGDSIIKKVFFLGHMMRKFVLHYFY